MKANGWKSPSVRPLSRGTAVTLSYCHAPNAADFILLVVMIGDVNKRTIETRTQSNAYSVQSNCQNHLKLEVHTWYRYILL